MYKQRKEASFAIVIKDQRGQVLVEFALALPIFLFFIYGLITLFFWGTTAILAQDVADEVARKYAVTMDKPSAENLGKVYLGRWAYLFIVPNSISINTDSTKKRAIATVTVKPRIRKLYFYELDTITKKSSCVLEDVWRNPENYD